MTNTSRVSHESRISGKTSASDETAASDETPASDAPRRGLGVGSLTALSAGGVIGLGVMSMPGIGIGIMGTGLWIAALIGALLSAIALIPQLTISTHADYPGGHYQQLRDLVDPRVGGIAAYIACFLVFDLSAYALSAAQLVVTADWLARGIAAILITVFVALHALGPRIAAVAQIVLCAALAGAFGLYAAYVVPHVNVAHLRADTVIGTPTVVAFACLYMTFMMNGTAMTANYAAVAREPRRTIPRAMLIALGVVAVAYVALCVIDAGLLPIDRVANRDLGDVAASFMPRWALDAFVVGGSAFALLTTLNAAIGWMLYQLRAAGRDGWLPAEFGASSRAGGVSSSLAVVVGFVAVMPVLVGVSTKTVSSSVTILVLLVQAALAIGAVRLALRSPAGLPRLVGCVAAAIVDALLVIWLLYTMSPLLIVGNAVLLIIAVIAALLRWRRL
ncbi:APC family permease [Bifidobacterium jacchi]|uniref:Amino acid permease n=1 Tax=Bifidobacterium jacchi TaxID=2490545 RepID=A0A5N5RGG3_9BIFI|nr:APC family permease [Bifidobacterium jacchi]KAB5606358.1 amino acid permease [Bifidobacterium jacchi]